MQKLRDLTDAKHFCHWETQPKLLKLLKKALVEPFGSNEPALCDTLFSSFDEFLGKRHTRGVAAVYNICTGRLFSPRYEMDIELVEMFATVRPQLIRAQKC